MIFRLFQKFKKEYKTLNRIEVIKDNLIHNYNYLSSLSKKVKIAPVLKSNGYGHGITNIAKVLQEKDPSFFCVDSLFEAYQIYNSKIKTPILITGYTNPQNLKVKKLPFSYALYTLDLAKVINKYQPDAGVHLFIDTGMGREGVTIDELPNFLKGLKQFPNLKIDGVMSHLASTKGKNDKLFQKQISNFKKALEILKEFKVYPKWIHIAASGGLINAQTRAIISQISNLSRAGLALYGLEDDENLKPTLKLYTSLGQIKKIKKGEKIGYDGTYTAKKDLTVGILPIGYNDGIDRRLSNIGYVSVGKTFCKILGRVSMNITAIDLSNIKNPQIGQEVLIYSENKKERNSINSASYLCKTIPYDLLIHLNDSIKRIIV